MRCLIFLFAIAHCSFAQINAAQQKALNSYVDYANQSAREIATTVGALKSYYTSVSTQKNWNTQRFACPVQPDTYYYNHALELNTSKTALNILLQNLKASADEIDLKCKALDTYYKLEDFKQDNHAKGEEIVGEFPGLLKDYQQKQFALSEGLEAASKKQMVNAPANAYKKSDGLMRAYVDAERAFLNGWSLNFHESLHTGWPDEALAASILKTDANLAEMKTFTPTLKYPASSMWISFQEALTSILGEKRRGLDGYNFDAKKSDRHSNEVYMNLINYYNGTLISSFNTFIQFSERDGYYGLKLMEYVPVFEIRTAEKVVPVDVTPYQEIPAATLTVTAMPDPVSKNTFKGLSNYIDLINEGTRQVRYLMMVLRNFNSSASYYSTLESFDKRVPMHFDYEKFQVPLSLFQKMMADSKMIPGEFSGPLNAQAQVLLGILREMDEHAASIDHAVDTRQYEADHLKKIYGHLERERKLFSDWDLRKEKLYQDVRKVYGAYPSVQQKTSWFISGNSLQQLVDLDHDALFKAKTYYTGDTSVLINTLAIDSTLREVIAREFDNMKGIEKLGRYNGLCPYSPYEDVPQHSRTFSEKLKKVKTASRGSGRHPYEALVYDYNNVVDQYNKFCELSAEAPLLKSVHQPEIFFIKYPDNERVAREEVREVKEERLPQKRQLSKEDSGSHGPVRVLHDTVYIEKRDTVYIREGSEDTRSMEGYAINNMVLLLDVSGSMNSAEKLPLLKKAVLEMLSMMRPEDEISVVAFSGKANILLKPVSFQDEEKIRKAINDLKSSGKTDAAAGIKLAYKVADGNYIRGGNNRIILATDGEFPLDESTKLLVQNFAEQDIFLTIFDFGKRNAPGLLSQLAALGKGNYEHISAENAQNKLIREAKSKKAK